MAVKILGNKMGSAKMAVRVELLLVLEAMAAVRVRVEEMESTPSSSVSTKSEVFSMGFPNKTKKSRKFSAKISKSRKALKMSFEKIMAAGWHNW